MNETKKSSSGGWLGLAIFAATVVVVLLIVGALIGTKSAERIFERHGYVLIHQDGVVAVATVTPIFEEWRR